MEEIVDFTTPEKKMPDFLKVLCILSFISLGFSILSSVAGTFVSPADNAEAVNKTVEDMREKFEESDRPMPSFFESMMDSAATVAEHSQLLNAVTLSSSLAALLGVILMWRLQKKGFWFYVLGQVISVFGTFTVIGNNTYSLITLAVSGLLSALFIALYALNLKHMQ